MNIKVNDQVLSVKQGTTIAAALMSSAISPRTSVSGKPRAALCGMGVCYECRAVVDGIQHTRTCMLLCEEGMEILTS